MVVIAVFCVLPAHAQYTDSRVINHGPRNDKKVALTFDADMSPSMLAKLKKGTVKSWYNKAILDELIKTQTKATIFATGMWIETYPQAAQELAQNPLIELANHSYSHPSLGGKCFGLSIAKPQMIPTEISKTQTLLNSLGAPTNLFRYPGGCYTKASVDAVVKDGLIPIQWDVVSGDAFSKNTKAIVHNVVTGVQPGSIVVMHLNGGPNAPKTAEALPTIISELTKEGYTFVTVSELLAQQ